MAYIHNAYKEYKESNMGHLLDELILFLKYVKGRSPEKTYTKNDGAIWNRRVCQVGREDFIEWPPLSSMAFHVYNQLGAHIVMACDIDVW